MTYPRDLVGYGRNPPDPQWPGKARVAINFVLNYEEGSEYSIADGDGASEAFMSEGGPHAPQGMRDLAAESVYEYGSRVGFWRLMRVFAQRKIPLTVFGCALALERNPQAARAIAESGHDVCAHGWRWIKHWLLSEEEERSHIRQAVESLTRTLGRRPLGWFCRSAPSPNTRRLVAEEGGFLYDSDTYNDELPYWVEAAGKPHLVIPYNTDSNDGKYYSPAGVSNGEEFLVYLKDTFDMLYEEGKSMPRMVSIGLHCRISGRPGRAIALARFLDYVSKHKHVWVCRREDVARHWIEHHPYQG